MSYLFGIGTRKSYILNGRAETNGLHGDPTRVDLDAGCVVALGERDDFELSVAGSGHGYVGCSTSGRFGTWSALHILHFMTGRERRLLTAQMVLLFPSQYVRLLIRNWPSGSEFCVYLALANLLVINTVLLR